MQSHLCGSSPRLHVAKKKTFTNVENQFILMWKITRFKRDWHPKEGIVHGTSYQSFIITCSINAKVFGLQHNFSELEIVFFTYYNETLPKNEGQTENNTLSRHFNSLADDFCIMSIPCHPFTWIGLIQLSGCLAHLPDVQDREGKALQITERTESEAVFLTKRDSNYFKVINKHAS